MILKYKLDNGAWKFQTVKDFTIGKVDISNVVNKHISNETGITNFYDTNTYHDLRNEFQKVSEFNVIDAINDYTRDGMYLKIELFNNHMNYLVISYMDSLGIGRCLILSNEAYLMSDEGKTIEKLM